MGHGIITRRGIDTSSATATSNKIIAPYTAFVNGVKLTGGVVDYSGSAVAGTPYNVDGSGNFGVRIPNSGVYSQDEILYAPAASVGINAEKIIEGHSILGVTGTQSLYEEDDLEVLDLTGYTYKGEASDTYSALLPISTTGSSTVMICSAGTSAGTVEIYSGLNSSGSTRVGKFSLSAGDSKIFKFVPNSSMVGVYRSSADIVCDVWQK